MSDPAPVEVDISNLTKAQLQALADSRGVEYNTSDTKEQLANKLNAAREANVAEEEVSNPGAATTTDTVLASHQGQPTVVDPALADPEGLIQARVEGRTSDAATHVEGTNVADVAPDNYDDVHSTDAEDYPFPVAGDVDVLTVDPDGGSDETIRPPDIEDWVVLGDDETFIPPRLQGRMAAVIEAPRTTIKKGEEDEYFFTVRTRDEVNATLVIPLSAVKGIARGGRNALLPVG